MLSPRYLAGLSDELIELYAQLETDILVDMARRIARLSKITDASLWQAQVLAEAGLLKKNIFRILHKYDRRIVQEIQAIFTDAMLKNAEADNRVFQEMTGRTISDNQAQMMLASIQKTHSDLSRLTLTTAETANTAFIQKANTAYLKVSSGAFDYNTAMKQAAREIAQEGITTWVTYNNTEPTRRTIESAVRMNILTGVNQTAAAMTVNNCEQLECDLVEVTAHIGARPEHEAWQGKIYSLSGTSEKYPPFSVCRFGEITGICGVNCRHSFYPYREGMERHYSDEMLEDMKQTVTYNGKTMSRYEGDQQLRGIERRIRHYKREAATAEAIEQDSTAVRQKIGEWQAKARDFTKQTGIRRDYSREYIGTVNGKQPRGKKA